MNYRHIYYASNFGDVMKHVVLALLLKSIVLKDTPLCVLDTHAGIFAQPDSVLFNLDLS